LTNKQEGSQTSIEILEVKYNVALDDKLVYCKKFVKEIDNNKSLINIYTRL
jgi:hypothetical protein